MDKTKEVTTLFEQACLLYKSIADTIEQTPEMDKSEDYINNVILCGEDPMFVDDEVTAGSLFQDINIGYAIAGIKYLEMIFNNKNVSIMATSYALNKLNEVTAELLAYKDKYGELEQENIIEEKKLQGIVEE